MEAKDFIPLIPFFPFLGFVILGLFWRKLPEKLASLIGCTGPFLAFLASIFAVRGLHEGKALSVTLYQWIGLDGLQLNFQFFLDPLSGTLCLIVTGVGFLIHLYSIGYMHGDKGYGKYFAYLNLFTSMMLVLVLGANLPLMFVGWEGVGLCSYLLIGFWFEDMEKSLAAQKAFIVNRVGDAAFLLGIFLSFMVFESLDFQRINLLAPTAEPWILALIGILFFIGATGKSAQIPLYVWLPDAMAGPTPVSALIHAATMVTAGVYMIGRLFNLYSLAPYVGDIVALVGALTALFAATIGITQRDIKKILAYSTISQLGYMFMAMGLGAYTLGIFHLTTHAFFKALLFLGSGAVIHAFATKDHPHGEQDIFQMGGLGNRMPVTFFAFIAGGFSLAALPPFSGFYSKDPILAYALSKGEGLVSLPTFIWLIGLVAAFFTTAYTFRMITVVFFGKPRGKVVFSKNPHPSLPMGLVLIILSILSIVGGFGLEHKLAEFLGPVFGKAGHIHISHKAHIINLVITSVCGVAIAVIVFILYNYKFEELKKHIYTHPVEWWMWFLSNKKYFVDEIYDILVVRTVRNGAKWLLKWVDFFIIEGIVNGIPKFFREMGSAFRMIQTGRVGQYGLFLLTGVLCLLAYIGYLAVFVF